MGFKARTSLGMEVPKFLTGRATRTFLVVYQVLLIFILYVINFWVGYDLFNTTYNLCLYIYMLLNLYSCCVVLGDALHNPKDSSDVTMILVAFVQQFWLAIWALGLLSFLGEVDRLDIKNVVTIILILD